jgi:hypothetical protein
MAKMSPYPPGLVARVQDPHEDKISAVLVPRPMGYLAVRIYFHGVPVEGLEVKFFKSDGGEKGAQVGDPVTTLADGIARVDMLVPAVEYICEINDQPPAVVTTVHEPTLTSPLVLPIGRPFVDVDEEHEFNPDFA